MRHGVHSRRPYVFCLCWSQRPRRWAKRTRVSKPRPMLRLRSSPWRVAGQRRFSPWDCLPRRRLPCRFSRERARTSWRRRSTGGAASICRCARRAASMPSSSLRLRLRRCWLPLVSHRSRCSIGRRLRAALARRSRCGCWWQLRAIAPSWESIASETRLPPAATRSRRSLRSRARSFSVSYSFRRRRIRRVVLHRVSRVPSRRPRGPRAPTAPIPPSPASARSGGTRTRRKMR